MSAGAEPPRARILTGGQRDALVRMAELERQRRDAYAAHPSDRDQCAVNGVTAGSLVRHGLARYVVGPVTGRRYLRITDDGRKRIGKAGRR